MFDRSLPIRAAIRTGAVLVLISALFAALQPAAAQVTTPPQGSPLRAAILDGVRPMVEAEVGKPVEFVVQQMRVLGEWAFVVLSPQRPGGGPIPYVYTRYQTAVDEGFFDNQVSALLRDTPSGWLVYEYNLGATDVPWVDWGQAYPVPPEVFPGN